MIEVLKIHEDNPRHILDAGLQELIQSLVLFPEMMSVRPITYNSDFVVLSGNQKLNALRLIKLEGLAIVKPILYAKRKWSTKTRKDELLELWQGFLAAGFPKDWFRHASEIDEDAELQAEYLIKANVHYGAWSSDKLAMFAADELRQWGIPAWQSQVFAPVVEPISDEEVNQRNAAFESPLMCPKCGYEFTIKLPESGSKI